MKDPQPPESEVLRKKTLWTAPVLENIGGMDQVKGGGNPGLDTNHLPAHS